MLLIVHRDSVLLFNIVINFPTSKVIQDLLLGVLFADDAGPARERVERVESSTKCLTNGHGLRVSDSKTEYIVLPISDPHALSPNIIINRTTIIVELCRNALA